jgi:hypothetical protein
VAGVLRRAPVRKLAGYTVDVDLDIDHPEEDRHSAKDLLEEARTRLSRLPVRDPRTADEILGYDDQGLPR